MMPGAVAVRIDIVSNAVAVVIRQRFLMQALLQVQLPPVAQGEGILRMIAGIVIMRGGNGHEISVARRIGMRENQVAVVQAHITGTGAAHVLLLIGQISFQARQGHIVNQHIRLGIGVIAGVQHDAGVVGHFQRKPVVRATIPFPHHVRDIVGIPFLRRAGRRVVIHIFIVQHLFAQSGRVAVGNGVFVPAAQCLPKVYGRGGRGLFFCFHIKHSLGNVVG